MAVPLHYYDGICRRRLIAAIIRKAREQGKRVPPYRKIATALGVSRSTVFYHLQKLKEQRG